MALAPDQYKIEKAPLHVPTLEEVAEVFRSYLPTNFAESEVEVVDCPDLLQDPFFLAERGLCGNPKIFEIGSTQYLLPLVQREKLYDLKDIAKAANLEPAYFIGAGAGPFPTYKGVNCEGIYNVKFNSTRIIEQLTRVAHVEGPDEHISTKIVPVNETRVALLGNLFGSEGNPGKVIKVHVKKRIGEKNFIETLRNSIEEKYGKEHLVGIGGAFLLVQGKAKHHIMRDFSKTPITDEEGVNNWLKFYNMSAPMIGVGTFVSNDGGALDLRVQHFHSYSTHREAGHYHYDTTPEIVEYLGYFNVAEEVVRVDQPALGHKLGRD
ncbi:ester hydrolase C11orf54 homolog isoform X2 [Anthonomus grandis grandis]|nr:ester hydrolase C11orf54 homolog isoform X2 [Anthonomus grandis grandis]XP_050310246.1 ester hydrolase C11orf54 homolog isoform X2 [Anthonomus grandis grandis]